MTRLVPGRVSRRWLASLSIVVVAVSIGLVGTWARSRSDLLLRSTSAYKSGDWVRAADLARARLKIAPNDLEALRILARATARLGRDGPANALFARLGSAALEPEDLYLLGLGLNRSGEVEKAERVWQRGIAKDSDHAETIEQLIRVYALRNRLAEAALLAERLAKQPGWEMRGELALGSLRSELDDPTGAATALRRALARPEASRLEPNLESRHRKTLVRSLLRTGNSGDARAALKPLLDREGDAEASWLLSRIALASGDASEATRALDAAGSYRKLHPLESEPCVYVGEARCAVCHAEVFDALQASRHSSTLMRNKELAELPYPDHPVADPDDPTVTHVFRKEQGQIRFETHTPSAVLKAIVQYAFGSRDHYTSLVGSDDAGRPHILRLSHFQTDRDSGWVRTTGHSADAEGGQDILGKPLDVVDGIHRCLFCHSTNPGSILGAPRPSRLTEESAANVVTGRVRFTSRPSSSNSGIARSRTPGAPTRKEGFGYAASAMPITRNRRCRAPIRSGFAFKRRPSPGAAATRRAAVRLTARPATTRMATTSSSRQTPRPGV